VREPTRGTKEREERREGTEREVKGIPRQSHSESNKHCSLNDKWHQSIFYDCYRPAC